CTLRVPPRLTFLNSAMSHCCCPGLYRKLRGAFPNVPAAGAANAAGLNQKLLSRPGPAEKLLFELAFASPVKLYCWPNPPAPTPAMSLVRNTENGVPVRRNVAPEICPPPSRFFNSDRSSRQNGRS